MAVLINSVRADEPFNASLKTAIGGSYPSAADTVLVNQGSEVYTQEKSLAADLAAFFVGGLFRGSVPATGGYCTFGCSAGAVNLEDSSGGDLALGVSSAGWAALNVSRKAAGARVLVGAAVGGYQVVNTYVTGGAVTFEANADAENVRAGGPGASVVLLDGGQTTALLEVRDRARASFSRAVTQVRVGGGGVVRCERTATLRTPKYDLQSGGTAVHAGGDVTELILLTGSVLDLSMLTQSITVTVLTEEEGVVVEPPAGVTVTWATAGGYVKRGRGKQMRRA